MPRRTSTPATTQQEASMAATPFPAPVPLPPQHVALEAARIAVQRQNEAIEREARAAGEGSVTLVAITSFTIVDTPDKLEGRVVNAGDEFTVSLADLPRYAGRGLPMVDAAG